MNKLDSEFGYRHYSDKGGHQERGQFWKSIAKLGHVIHYLPTKEIAWLIKRDMPRHPRNGK